MPGFEPRTVQPVASLYTDYTIPTQNLIQCSIQLPTWDADKFFPIFYKINGSLSHNIGIMNSVHTTTCYFCEINLNIIALIILKSGPFPSGFLAKIFVCNSHLYQTQNVSFILSAIFLSTGNFQEHNDFQCMYIIIKIL